MTTVMKTLCCVCVCRRKKKCIRYSVGEDDAVCKDGGCEALDGDEDDVILGGEDVLATSTASSVLLSEASDHHHVGVADKLPRLLSHEVPVTLQTIPT